MESMRLGQAGLHVSRLALGTINFGSELDEQASFAIMDRAADMGIYHIDVADMYPAPESPGSWGRSEIIVGNWLKGKQRDQYVVASKCVARVGTGPNDIGGSRKHIIEACEKSLRRLGTDRIDLYYLHRSDVLDAPFEESLAALDHLVRQGKVLYLGVSNFSAWQVALLVEIIAKEHFAPLTALQDRHNLVCRRNERDLYPLAQAKGFGLLAYNPIAAGMLAGLFKRGDPIPEGGRFTMPVYQERYFNEEVYDVVDEVRDVAFLMGVPMAQVALAWILSQDFGVSPIVGALVPEHFDDTGAALELKIPDEIIERLNKASSAFL
jgi:aryl-alcohol dehydrogenase (NADP+)